MSGLSLGIVAYMVAVTGTGGDRLIDQARELPPVAAASLDFAGVDPIITGSVSSLFETPMFSGANRSAKSDRVRPQVDIAAFIDGFDAARLSIAEQRLTATPDIMVAQSGAGDDDRITVASVNRDIAGAEGLRAIDALADGLDPTIPRPVSVPTTLAYGRAATPATDFTPNHSWSEREQWCMATGIYFEARGETYRGQVAVAQVIMNRVDHDNYPNTICGVVFQNQHRRNACQFSFACDGKTNVNRPSEAGAWALAQEITQTVLNKEIYLTEVADATHYHATYVRPHWARNMDRLSQVGLHVFYRFRSGWQFG